MVGAIVIADHLVDVAQFRKEDTELVDTLAGALSIAIENSVLERMLKHSKVLERELDHLAHHDPLTGLPNRVRFTERVAELTRSARRPAGTSPCCSSTSTTSRRSTTAWVTTPATSCSPWSRSGSRRASVRTTWWLGSAATSSRSWSRRSTTTKPAVLADRIHEALVEPVALGSGFTRVSASIGIAYSSGLVDTSELLRSADAAMYHAKANGKRRSVVYQPSMHASMVERYELLNQLDRAIDDHEITIVFQPLVTLDGCLRGGEALARWNHPNAASIHARRVHPARRRDEHDHEDHAPRARPRPVARSATAPHTESASTSLRPTSRSRTSARWCRECSSSGGFVPTTSRSRSPSRRSCSTSRRCEAFTALRRVGVRLALDDFGTGYSSLAALREYPINQLKIAKPFIDDLETDPAAVRFVELIVGLGRSLDMEVVAEGIERKAQVDILGSVGCHLGQGYYFALAAHPRAVPLSLGAAISSRRNRSRTAWLSPAMGPESRT